MMKGMKQILWAKTVYTYYNADGSIAYTKNRFDKADGKKSFSFVRPNGEKGLGDKKPVPYNLPEVIRAQKVYFVEGEKCADADYSGRKSCNHA
mgnify:CR=1 FL=1